MISIMAAKATTDLERNAVTVIITGYAGATTLRIEVANTVIYGQHIPTLIYLFCNNVMMMLN